MPVQVYTLKITYAGCDNRIWRTAAVSSNYTLAELGYMVLSTFDTMAYHLFNMKYKNTLYYLSEKLFEDLSLYDKGNSYDLLWRNKIGKLNMNIGDTIEMVYDPGCWQKFNIVLTEIGVMPKGHGPSYPKILDGAGKGIVDDMCADQLLEVINKIDTEGHSEIYYSGNDNINVPEWDYRNYDIRLDNLILKMNIDMIRDGYEKFGG